MSFEVAQSQGNLDVHFSLSSDIVYTKQLIKWSKNKILDTVIEKIFIHSPNLKLKREKTERTQQWQDYFDQSLTLLSMHHPTQNMKDSEKNLIRYKLLWLLLLLHTFEIWKETGKHCSWLFDEYADGQKSVDGLKINPE